MRRRSQSCKATQLHSEPGVSTATTAARVGAAATARICTTAAAPVGTATTAASVSNSAFRSGGSTPAPAAYRIYSHTAAPCRRHIILQNSDPAVSSTASSVSASTPIVVATHQRSLHYYFSRGCPRLINYANVDRIVTNRFHSCAFLLYCSEKADIIRKNAKRMGRDCYAKALF